MGERKGQSKYYPPDFDPTRLAPIERTSSHKVRMMMPMSVQCITCAEYIYTGKKFNSTIECANEAYLGIKIWRLTVRCPKCAQAITLKTDPQNCDYICESGATRNFEPWRSYNMETAEMNAEREDAKKDVMKDLEAKQYDAKKEMDALNQLDALVTMSAKRTGLTPDDLLTFLLEKNENDDKKEFTAEEESEIAKFKELQKSKSAPKPEEAAEASVSSTSAAAVLTLADDVPVPSAPPGSLLLKKKRKKPTVAPNLEESAAKKAKAPTGLGLDYGSDDA